LPLAIAANEGVDITAGEPIIYTFQLAISGRSHEGIDIAGERIIVTSQLAMIRAVAANEGIDIAAGEPIIFIFQLAISGRSHEGIDIAGEQIIFYFPACKQQSQPT
jgi:hypothetical protein